MISLQFISALRELDGQLKASHVNWALVGSLGLALRGFPLEPHDIDIMTDREGAFEIQRVLSRSVIKPVALRISEKIRSYFGTLEIDGVKVEVMGDFQMRSPDGSWEEPVKLEFHKQHVSIDEMRVPVLSMEYEYEANLKLGRMDRASLLRDILKGGIRV